MTGSFPSASHTLARCTKNILPCALAVAVWATMSAQTGAGTIYSFSTDSSPQPYTYYPQSDLTGFFELDSSGNLVTYDFSLDFSSGGIDTFTSHNSSLVFEYGFLQISKTAPPPLPQFIDLLYIGGADYEQAVDAYTGIYILTDGFGHWTVQQFVPEPPTITLAFFAAVCGIVYAVARKRRAQRKATRESQAFAASA